MDHSLYKAYLKILQEELVPAMGCTEPIAVAYAGAGADRALLTVEGIVEFAETARIEDVRETLQRQIDCNTAIARQGLTGRWATPRSG